MTLSPASSRFHMTALHAAWQSLSRHFATALLAPQESTANMEYVAVPVHFHHGQTFGQCPSKDLSQHGSMALRLLAAISCRRDEVRSPEPRR